MAKPKTAPKIGKTQRSESSETLRFFLKLALAVLILRSFIFSPFSIPSESMLPRLLIGDYLFVSKWNYGFSRWSLPFGIPLIPSRIFAHDPVRGDTVVFRSMGPDDHDVIKRVIGLPGDTIQVTNGQVILNGKAIPKQRIADFVLPLSPNFGPDKCGAPFQGVDAQGVAICRYPRFRETLPGGRSYEVLDQADIPVADDTGLYTVPAGNVFLMGDNRDDSADSRFPPPEGMGYIPMERIEGKAQMMFFSTDGSASYVKPWTWFSAARWERIGGGFLSDLTDWLTEMLGQTPGDLALYDRALTHGSQSAISYERLEFLGDRVLGLNIAEWLYDLFPTEPEGSLSKRFNALVTGAVCADVARGIGVPDRLRLGKQARDDGASASDNVLGDVMEALIGATFLDHGAAQARALVRRLWDTRVQHGATAPQHPKSALQEWAAAHDRKPPTYEIVDRSGPGHAPRFTIRASIANVAEVDATGGSKQQAQTAAAKALLAVVTALPARNSKTIRTPKLRSG